MSCLLIAKIGWSIVYRLVKDWRNLNGEKTAFKNLSWFTKHKAFQGNEANYGQRGVYIDLMKHETM